MRLWAEVKLQALTRHVHLSWDKVTGMCGYVMSVNVGRLAMVVVGGIVDRRLVLLVIGGIIVDRQGVLIIDRKMRGRLEFCCIGLENLVL